MAGRRRQAKSLLPSCPGPKLGAFKHKNSAIEWGRRLDVDRTDLSGTQASVFEVKIESKVYALKVFKFFNPTELKYYWGPLLGDSYALKKILFYTDPFFAECRAYGRIQECQKELRSRTKLVVKCHGYIFLSKKDERHLQEQGVDMGSNLLGKKLRRATGGRGRIRAIVKDLAPENKPINKGNFKAALRNVKDLNGFKIYNRDIRAENFKGPHIVDFGSSWTEPHCLLDALEDWTARESRLEDLVMFDNMVTEEGITESRVALPNLVYLRKLRSSSKKEKET